MTNVLRSFCSSLTKASAFRWRLVKSLNTKHEREMVMGKAFRVGLTVVLASAGAGAASPAFADSVPPHKPVRAPASGFFDDTSAGGAALARAQQSYAAGDVKAAAEGIAQALKGDVDPLVRSRALELLGSSYKEFGARGIPVDWQLPREITRMRVQVQARDSGDKSISYSIRVAGSDTAIGVIKQLQIVRYPDQVLLDKKAGIGNWGEDLDITDHKPYYWLGGPSSKTQIPGGLFFLNIEMASGEKTQGWFVMEDDMNSTATPELSSPSPGDVYDTATPTFTWTPFRSPEYKATDARTFFLGVEEITHDDNWKDVWSYYPERVDNTEVTLGSIADSSGVSSLEAGKQYLVYLNFGERRYFGPLQIVRQSQTQRRFTVKK